MSSTEATASVEVGVDPQTAFEVFTGEIDLWWVRGPINFYDASRLTELRMEPGVGGRVVEVYDESAGDVLVTAEITIWEPGRRLVLRGTMQETETDVRFEKTATGTRVQVTQFLLPGADPRKGGLAWVGKAQAYEAWTRRRDESPRRPREVGRLAIVLYYEDPKATARWLMDVFRLGSWDVDVPPAEDDTLGWTEFHVGDSSVVLLPIQGQRPVDMPVVAMPWVYVDDLEAHFAHAVERGAEIVSEIRSHGSRTYSAEDREGYRWTFAQARPTMR